MSAVSFRKKVLLATSLIIGGSACNDASLGPESLIAPSVSLVTRASTIPARDELGGPLPRWSTLPDAALWTQAVKGDSLFAIGIKHPDLARGIYRGQRLIGRPAVQQFVSRLAADVVGLEVVREIDSLPVVIAKLNTVGALGPLRQLPFID